MFIEKGIARCSLIVENCMKLMFRRKEGEAEMSLGDLRKKIYSLGKAIEDRKKLISSLEANDNPENIIRIVTLKSEVSILESEKIKLENEYQVRKAEVEQQYPKMLREYGEKVNIQKRILGEVIEAAEILKQKLQKLRNNIDEVEKTFHPYRSIAVELGVPTKHMHLVWGDVFIRLSRELENFLSWYQKTRGG
jgi:hypothetical protein